MTMTSAISLSSVGSFACRSVLQQPAASELVKRVALSALKTLVVSLKVIPTILPVAMCIAIGTIIAFSLFLSCHPPVIAASFHPDPLIVPMPITRPHYYYERPPVVYVQPRRVFSPPPRLDRVGERSSFSNIRPTEPRVRTAGSNAHPASSFRTDRVGERSHR